MVAELEKHLVARGLKLIEPAVGAALAYKLKGEPHVALAICGDGATSNGRWHESLNWSAIARLPVVWIVNNNRYAYSTPNELEFPVPTVAERAAAYKMPGVRVDGADVLAVEKLGQHVLVAGRRDHDQLIRTR